MHCHKTGLGAQCAHPEPRSRAQCPCHGRCCAHSKLVARMSRRQPAQVAHSVCAGRAHSAQVVGACRDLMDDQARSRRQSHVAISVLLHQNSPGRDLKNGVATPLPWGSQNHVATSNRCRDITQANPGHDTKTRSRPSWRLTYVATSISCRDLVSAHSGISRSRRPTPGRDLPHCYPCRDLKSAQPNLCYVATPFFPVATFLADTHVATSSRPSQLPTPLFFFLQNPPIAFPATPHVVT